MDSDHSENISASDVEEPLLPVIGITSQRNVHIRVYKRRWYILFLFSTFCFTQGFVWNTFGPISTSCEVVFGWNDATIAWLSNWGGVAFVLTSFLFYWLMQVKGLRLAVLLSTFSLLVGTALRVITYEPKTATVLIHIGQIISGLAGPIAMGANPTVSAIWFPPSERITATAISSNLGYFGVAFSYLIGPWIVGHGSSHVDNSTLHREHLYSVHKFSNYLSSHNESMNDDPESSWLHHERDQIMLYMYISGGWCALLFLATLCYFPDTPPHPPSLSAHLERTDYWTGLQSLCSNGHYMIIAIAYGISLGPYGAWQSVLTLNLRPTGISQREAGWIGFYSIVASCFASVFVARFADYFTGRIKLFICILYVLSTACFAIFSVELLDSVPYYDAVLYAAVIVGSSFLLAASPLMFELACELAYPASEGAANGSLAFVNNFVAVLFFIPFAFPHIGTMWMNWLLTACCGLCIPLIAVMRGRFSRLLLDGHIQPDQIHVTHEENAGIVNENVERRTSIPRL